MDNINCFFRKAGMLFCVLGLSFYAVAQTEHTHHLPNVGVSLNSTLKDSSKVSNVSLGFWSNIDALKGIQIGLLHAHVNKTVKGLNFSGLSSITHGSMHGVALASLFNIVGGELKGVQVSALGNLSRGIKGVQISGTSNLSLETLNGLQLSGVSNISEGVKHGVQVSMIQNISRHTMGGLQLGAYNYADTLTGIQLGVINRAGMSSKGIQVGLFNISKDTISRKWGLVNVSPNTKIDFLLYGGNTSKINSAWRFRQKHTFQMIGIGTYYKGFDEKFSGTLFYRWGAFTPLSQRFMMGADLGFYHIEISSQGTRYNPKHLYSLQAHVNADYKLSKRWGIFASVGYGQTRRYGDFKNYKNEWVGQLGLSYYYDRETQKEKAYSFLPTTNVEDSAYYSLLALPEKKRPWRAAFQTALVNMLVFSYNRFYKDMDYAHISLKSIKENLTSFPVWDNDPFTTNLFEHPYHGSQYFTAARSNGLSFWNSLPYAVAGSAMWEYLGENEPPSLNDLIATSLGGSTLGEVSYRISRIILNDKTRGVNRFLREFGAFVVSPVHGINRLLRGETWRVKTKNYLYHDIKNIPLDLKITLGNRYLADNGATFRGEQNPYINVSLEYGNAFNDEQNKPFDYFTADFTMGFSSNQPRISQVHLLGRLWSAPVITTRYAETEFGLFQHFNLYDSSPVKDGTSIVPYRISEAVGIGPGVIYRLQRNKDFPTIKQQLYANIILLGGSISDYYNKVAPRDYNMGGGYSLKSNTTIQYPQVGSFSLITHFYHLFTLKGYETKDLTGLNQLHFNVQGDKSNAVLLVISPKFQFKLNNMLSAILSGSYYYRHTHYKYYSNVETSTFEAQLGLSVKL